ncbi:MAG: HGGxSTG domain-containing protein [Candidatus Hydrogenedentes bacterium]|nr:HGGxSTG domain-containing protein [Candidatus Hydrogenedentota bacterium]
MDTTTTAQSRNDQIPLCTSCGTPYSKLWDYAWIEKVHATEQTLNRRICGARTQAGTVCTLESDHASGRCRFHGGFDLTGAPKVNRNAVGARVVLAAVDGVRRAFSGVEVVSVRGCRFGEDGAVRAALVPL